MKPIEAMEKALEMSVLSSRGHQPGVVIAGLSRETRAALEQLTSDDALRMRPDWLFPMPAPKSAKGRLR